MTQVTASRKIAETAKAILFKVNGVEKWIPKSVISNVRGLSFNVADWFYTKNFAKAMDIMPVSGAALSSWNGYGRKGQALYDQQFAFEMGIADAEDIVRDPDPSLYSQEQIDCAYATIEKFR